MKNEIRRDGKTLSLANWRTEVRAEPNLRIKGKIYTNTLSADMGGWKEMIGRGAFNESLRNRNIYMLWQHEHAGPLANTKNKTLQIWEENDGYAFDAKLANTQLGRDMYELVKSGTVSETSFAMSNIADSWQVRDDEDIRVIQEATLHEISPVTWVAYPSAYVTARSNTNNELTNLKPYFIRDGSKTKMTKEEIERRKKRDEKFWQHGTEFKTVAEQFNAIRAFDEIGREDPRLEQRTEGLLNDDFALKADLTTKLFKVGNVSELWTRALTISIENYAQIKMPIFDEKSRVNGSLLGGINFEWVEQGATIDYTNPKFRSLDMELFKMLALVPFTSEMAADATSFETVMESISSKGLNYMIDDAVIRGTGAGRSQGCLRSNCKVRCSKEAGQNANTITSANIFAMLSRIIPECWTNGDLVWLGHPSTLPQVSALTESVGAGGGVNPLWHWR